MGKTNQRGVANVELYDVRSRSEADERTQTRQDRTWVANVSGDVRIGFRVWRD